VASSVFTDTCIGPVTDENRPFRKFAPSVRPQSAVVCCGEGGFERNRDITPAILVIPGELPAFIDGCLRIEGGLLHPVVGQPSL
jgi:hypothetical protein